MSISVAPKVNLSSVQQTILPGQTCAFDLGSITLQFRNAFLNGYLSLLGSEAGALERRLQENVGDVQLVNAANTLLRSLNTDILPTTLGPASIATIGTSTSYARGDHIHGIDVSGTGFDGRYIKRSPSGENQTIQPLTDNTPLTLKGAPGVLVFSDLFEVLSSTGAILGRVNNSGVLVWNTTVQITPPAGTLGLSVTPGAGSGIDVVEFFGNTGNLAFEMLPSGAIILNPGINLTPLAIVGLAPASQTIDLFEVSNAGFTGTLSPFRVGPTGATTILPSTNVVPLTLQESVGGSSDILDILDSSATVQALFQSTGRAWFKQQSAIGALAPISTSTLQVAPPSGVSPGGTFNLNNWSQAYTLNAAAAAFRLMNVSGITTSAGTGLTGLVFSGFGFAATVNPAATDTFSTIRPINIRLTLAGGSGGTATEVSLVGLQCLTFSTTVTTLRYVYCVTFTASTTIGTAIGVDIEAMPANTTTKIGIRQLGASDTNRLAGNTRIGDTGTAPLANLEVNGGTAIKINTRTIAYSALISDSVILADATTGPLPVTLPAAASSGSGVGQRIEVIKIDTSANAVTVSAAAGDTIEGAASVTLVSQYKKAVLQSDNVSKWYDLGAGLV